MKKQKKTNISIQDFNFIGNHVLLKAIKITENKEGVIKPKQQDDKPEFGTILSVGDKADNNLKEGDIVLFSRYLSESIDIEGETYYFVRDEDIKGVKKRVK